uniref:Uncharacterized protein n=1 Tax=Oryza rufipogon TaxID=4529 RepID=A0A0E0PCP9_ORYRU
MSAILPNHDEGVLILPEQWLNTRMLLPLERAEKRKKLYQKSEEKIHAKELEQTQAKSKNRRGADSLHPLCPMLRPPHSAEKGTGDDGMLCAECSGERARATTACSAQSAQGRTSHRQWCRERHVAAYESL